MRSTNNDQIQKSTELMKMFNKYIKLSKVIKEIITENYSHKRYCTDLRSSVTPSRINFFLKSTHINFLMKPLKTKRNFFKTAREKNTSLSKKLGSWLLNRKKQWNLETMKLYFNTATSRTCQNRVLHTIMKLQ